MLEDIQSMLMGIDKNKEIINLWFELDYQRNLLMEVMKKNSLQLDEQMINVSREEAQKQLIERFPKSGISFQPIPKSPEPSEKQQED